MKQARYIYSLILLLDRPVIAFCVNKFSGSTTNKSRNASISEKAENSTKNKPFCRFVCNRDPIIATACFVGFPIPYDTSVQTEALLMNKRSRGALNDFFLLFRITANFYTQASKNVR